MEKQLPQNLEVEAAVLGAILFDPGKINDIVGEVKPIDFYSTAHKYIFRMLEKMYSEGINIDIISLATQLKNVGFLEKVGGITYITKLQDSYIENGDIKTYLKIIKENSNKRELIVLAQEVLKQGYDSSITSKKAIENMMNKLSNIESYKKGELVHIGQAINNVLEGFEKGIKRGLTTGFYDIDKITNGLEPGKLIILAARPSMGKTTLALNIAENISIYNTVAVFSLEMSKEELAQKILSANSNVEFTKIKNGEFENDDFDKVAKASQKIHSRKIYINDSGTLTVNDIRADCKKIKIQKGLDVVVIDYLQLIECKGKDRLQEISEITRELKKLSKELGVTLIVLSQLSRACEQRNDHRPILADLRESGSIEQDADIVMFLYRDEYYNPETEDKNIAECIFAKNRTGETGFVKLAWLSHIQRFADLDFKEYKYSGQIKK